LRPSVLRQRSPLCTPLPYTTLFRSAVLMAADRAVDRVVVDHDGDVETVLSRGGHLLTVHQEVTVAGDAEHGPFGVDESGGDRGRQTEAHRSVARSQRRGEP